MHGPSSASACRAKKQSLNKYITKKIGLDEAQHWTAYKSGRGGRCRVTNRGWIGKKSNATVPALAFQRLPRTQNESRYWLSRLLHLHFVRRSGTTFFMRE